MAYTGLSSCCKNIINGLKSHTNFELDQLMNDDEKIESLINDNDLYKAYLKDLDWEKETFLTSINQMRDANLAREPELIEGREEIETLSKEGEELSKIVEEKYKNLRDKGGDMSMETALALLQTAASEMEEESDTIAKSFLDSDKDLDAFLEEFLVKRKLMHLRLVKAEKMTKLISNSGFYSPTSNYVNVPPMSVNSNFFPGVPPVNPSSVPYPVGPLNMPLPQMNYFQNH